MAKLTSAMHKLPKDDPSVNYSDDRGKPNHHCGPTPAWRKGYCRYYLGFAVCEKVKGEIAGEGGCDLYQKAKEA